MIKITVDNELSDYIESLQYDRNAIADLLIMAAQRGIQDGAAFEKWTNDYKEANRKYEIAKNELVQRFVLPAVGHSDAAWNLDFNTATLTITEEAPK